MVFTHEILVPAHAPVRRRVVALAAERGTVDHHHGYLGCIGRNHVLDVQSIDCDLIVRAEAAEFDGGLRPAHRQS